jgi:hypothetical protein
MSFKDWSSKQKEPGDKKPKDHAEAASAIVEPASESPSGPVAPAGLPPANKP